MTGVLLSTFPLSSQSFFPADHGKCWGLVTPETAPSLPWAGSPYCTRALACTQRVRRS